MNDSSSSQEDRCAASLVRIQLLTEKIGESPWRRKFDTIENIPPTLFHTALLEQVRDLKLNISPQLDFNGWDPEILKMTRALILIDSRSSSSKLP